MYVSSEINIINIKHKLTELKLAHPFTGVEGKGYKVLVRALMVFYQSTFFFFKKSF